jgi:hypothetical protein
MYVWHGQNVARKFVKILLCQKEVGDVSSVIWDAALVLAKYLEARFRDM